MREPRGNSKSSCRRAPRTAWYKQRTNLQDKSNKSWIKGLQVRTRRLPSWYSKTSFLLDCDGLQLTWAGRLSTSVLQSNRCWRSCRWNRIIQWRISRPLKRRATRARASSNLNLKSSRAAMILSMPTWLELRICRKRQVLQWVVKVYTQQHRREMWVASHRTAMEQARWGRASGNPRRKKTHNQIKWPRYSIDSKLRHQESNGHRRSW